MIFSNPLIEPDPVALRRGSLGQQSGQTGPDERLDWSFQNTLRAVAGLFAEQRCRNVGLIIKLLLN